MFGLGYSKEKSRASAEKYLQQNKLQNAISEYEKILQAEPKDFAILNTVGDIYSRLGQNEKAIERFRTIGDSYVADGSTVKAIAMYKKITKLDPNGLATMEKLAELYRKQGLVSDARSMLLQTAEAYTRKGQSKETLRLLKQLVLFDPENVQVITRTADLMTQGGQKNEAKQMLSQSASTLIARSALAPALKVLEHLIALDRSNMKAQELRAQVTLELGDAGKAAEYFELIPDLDSRVDGLRNLLTAYLKLGNLEGALGTARKLVSVHQDSDGIIKVADRLYKENETLQALALYKEFSTQVLAHDKEEVIAHLHGSVSRVRNNPDALQTLYDLFQRAGEISMIAEILELLAHACVQAEQYDRARNAYKELIELEPENSSHMQGYRQVCAHLDSDGTVPLPPPPAAKAEHSLEEFLTGKEPELPTQAYSPELEEAIGAALTEAELCESFSSKKRGIDALELALQTAPEDLRLNRTLGMLYLQEGNQSKAARCYSTLHRVLESMGASEAAGYYANAAGSEQTTTWEAKGNEFAARDFELSDNPEAPTGGAEEIDLSAEWESVWEETAPQSPSPAPPTPIAASPTPAPAPALTTVAAVTEMLEEVHFCLAQQIWAEAETGIARIAAVFPEHPELPSLRAQLAQGQGRSVAPPAQRYEPVEVIELGGAFPPAPSFATPAPPSFTPAAAPTLNSLAAELDFELGETYEPAAQPHPAATPRPAAPPVQQYAQPAQPYAPPAQPYAPPAARYAPPPAVAQPSYMAAPVIEPEVDLTPSVFGDLLQDFEQDLAAPQENEGDPETHFNLGIAFREMGLLDEAIGELQKVCRAQGLSPDRAQQAYIWLATCFVEKDVPEASLKWFQRALETAPDEDSHTAVNYELASAYEAAGRKREALDHFLEVYGTNIDYRDVASRIRDLRAVVQ